MCPAGQVQQTRNGVHEAQLHFRFALPRMGQGRLPGLTGAPVASGLDVLRKLADNGAGVEIPQQAAFQRWQNASQQLHAFTHA